MKIVDCFIFYNEVRMLIYRLEYLYNTVDYFVIVEATKTHAGNPKPLYFGDNKSAFSKYLDKIVHVVVDDMPSDPRVQPRSLLTFRRAKPAPESGDTYNIVRENHQRRCIHRGISILSLSHNDIIMISDLDEIPDRDTIARISQTLADGIYELLQDLYYYNLTCKNINLWTQARILNYKTYLHDNDPEKIRMTTSNNKIQFGGWHFSYFGGSEFILNKLKNFCHAEAVNGVGITKEDLEDRIRCGVDLFGRSDQGFQIVPIESNRYLPVGIQSLSSIFTNTLVVQLGTNNGKDDVNKFCKTVVPSKIILVEPFAIHNDDIREQYINLPFTIENIAVSDTDSKEITMYYTELDGPQRVYNSVHGSYQVTSTSPEHLMKYYPRNALRQFSIPSMNINSLFEKHELTTIDYLFIDIEGLDLTVLKSIDFLKYNIRNIQIEHVHINQDELNSFMNIYGFKKKPVAIDSSGFDTLYSRA
jgi:beta-1,4-mannosyl-glycoprotein beta-1,4-N-acetylglucosaminyltransferase